mmetsp:Transcript_21427/g.55951  ORF Transcript_21427/g.55951 Transcript_21427/m.55951 type:complete len:271 (+) Transcript_21427:2575-3387(+)
MQMTHVVAFAGNDPRAEKSSLALHANARTAAAIGRATHNAVRPGSCQAVRSRFVTKARAWPRSARHALPSSERANSRAGGSAESRLARRRSSSSPTRRKTSSRSVPPTPTRTGSASRASRHAATGASAGSANSKRGAVRAMTRWRDNVISSPSSSKRRSQARAPGAVRWTMAATRSISCCGAPSGFAPSEGGSGLGARSWISPSACASGGVVGLGPSLTASRASVSSRTSTTSFAPQPSDRFKAAGASAHLICPPTMIATTSPNSSASSM